MTAHAQSTDRGSDTSVLQLIERRWTELSPDGAVQLSAVFEQLRAIEQQEAAVASDEQSLRAFRDRWESRKSGILTKINDHWLAAAPKDAKGEIGRELNRLRQLIREHIEAAEQNVRSRAAAARLESERVDITLPARAAEFGPAHPITTVMERIVEIFVQLGYSVAEGPEMETVYYNFEALNVPESHPARDDQDTLYLGPDLPGVLLRTHTSPVQIRTMEAQQPPLRVIAPGKVYRRDAPDLTHSPMFHQVEGLAVDEGIALADLKGTLDHFAREMFGAGVRTRFRPSYFPFTEPSAEMDVSCIFCGGRGCRACKQSGWIEVLGCGMVDPELYKFVHYDPQRWSGFAFGMGVDRLAMLMYGVDDVQRFFTGELRFLEQFRD